MQKILGALLPIMFMAIMVLEQELQIHQQQSIQGRVGIQQVF